MKAEAVVNLSGIGEHYRTEITEEMILTGWFEMPCPDCDHNGSNGVFTHPDGSEHECIHCSGTGTVCASLQPMYGMRHLIVGKNNEE